MFDGAVEEDMTSLCLNGFGRPKSDFKLAFMIDDRGKRCPSESSDTKRKTAS